MGGRDQNKRVISDIVELGTMEYAEESHAKIEN